MISELKLKGESILKDIEDEIISVKTNAFDKSLRTLIPIKILRDPYIRDYQKKLERQGNIIFAATRQIIMSCDSRKEKIRIIKKSFEMFFKKDPIYSLLLMYIPSFIKSIKINKILNELEKVNFRYYRIKINENIAILEYLSRKQIDFELDENELLNSVFPDENVVNAFLHNYLEKEKMIYSIIKKGGNWKKTFSVFDTFSSFSITMIPLYRLTSNIRMNTLQALDTYARDKMWKIYYKDSSCKIYSFKDCQEKDFRHKILFNFPVSPEIVFEKMTDPEILTKTNPDKTFKVTQIADNRMRYDISINLIIVKMKIYWETVSKFTYNKDFIFEEWHIENSNYAESMDGFCLFERTPNNHCRYANITKTFIPNKKLALLGDVILIQLENISNQNTEKMMKNIGKLIIKEKK